MNKNSHHSLNFAVSMTLFTVFALFLTLVLLTGASSFRSVSEGTEERYTERTPLLYVSQRIRSADRAGMIKITEIDNIPALLMLSEPYGDGIVSGEIQIYIYYHDGFLKEFYAFDGEAPRLEIGQAIFPADSAEFELITSSLIKITINGKSIFVNLSSEVSI